MTCFTTIMIIIFLIRCTKLEIFWERLVGDIDLSAKLVLVSFSQKNEKAKSEVFELDV